MMSAQFSWKTYSVPIRVKEQDPPLRCYKRYTRNGKTFWRNYRRSVPGGMTFVERFGEVADITRRATEAHLARVIFRD